MRALIEKLNKATYQYEIGHPTMSDEEWDNLYFKLKELEKENGFAYPDSPTQKIFEVVSELEKSQHDHQMLSLDKTKDLNVIKDFLGNKDFITMCKMDGLTCSLKYENGVLIKAETRGNGVVGENILHNAKVIYSIPKFISYKDTLVVDGEIICSYEDFSHFNSEYKNPRNFAAGSIRLLDSKECSKRRLQFIAWDVIEGFNEENFLDKKFNLLKKLGFTIVPYAKNLLESGLKDKAQKLGYPIDGLVYKFNDIAYGRSLGQTAHHFKNALAYKFYDETYPTKLLDIEWTMGRTGALTPVAIFEPVEIDSCEVSRASLHNISILEEILGKCYYTGQQIEVFKANAIIPQIAWADKRHFEEKNLSEPTICPICGKEVKRVKENNSIILVCTNESCSGKLINRLDHFCGKKGLDIKGLSIATLEKLIDWGWINNLFDILNLKKYREEWIKKPEFGIRSVDKILNSIETAKNTSLDKFISSLGIPLIGVTVSKDLCKYVDSYEDFRKKIDEKFNFAKLEGFADSKTEALLNFDYSEADKIYPILSITNNKKEEKSLLGLKDLTVVITGKLNSFKNRTELQKEIESRGGKVVGSVSSKTKILINNDATSSSTKNSTAKKLGIPILTEKEFIENFLNL